MTTNQLPASDRYSSKHRPGLTVAGNCHRVAVAVENVDDAIATLGRVFGLGLMLEPINDSLDDTRMGIVWAGNMPLLAMGSTDPEGTVGRYLRRNGPSVQSLAWEIDDMWGTDHRLRANGITVTGVNIDGRHFFMHPRDTFGLLLEFTDDRLPHDPRQGDQAPASTEGIIHIDGIAWVTAAVPDLDDLVEQFRVIFGLEPVRDGVGASLDRVVEFTIGDLTVRVVEPADEDSPYAASVQSGTGRWHSAALAVSDFATIDKSVQKARLGVIARLDRSVWIDPKDMHGIRFELVSS